MDKINQNWSFEVVAIPEENLVLPAANITPMKIKIRVKKGENTADPFQGIISVPKFKNRKYAEKIRVVHSDQTIMSFNMLTETKQTLKSSRKSQNKFFHIFKTGKCLGAKNEDDKDPPYMVSCSGNAEALLKTTEDEEGNITSLETNSDVKTSNEVTKYPVYFLGKCKPGGCLDPPFSEDKYRYLPAVKPKLTNFDEKEKYKNFINEESNKNESENYTVTANSISKAKVDSTEKETSSTLMLYKAKEENKLVEEKYSGSIITYPPELLSAELDKQDMSRKTSIVKNRHSIDITDIYFVPKKLHKGLEKDKNKRNDMNTREKILSKESPLPSVENILSETTRKLYKSEPTEGVMKPELNLLQLSEINAIVYSNDLERREPSTNFKTQVDKDQDVKLKSTDIDQNKISKLLTSNENTFADTYLRDQEYNKVETEVVSQQFVDNNILQQDQNSQNLKFMNLEQTSYSGAQKEHTINSLEFKESIKNFNYEIKEITPSRLEESPKPEAQLDDPHSSILNGTKNDKNTTETDVNGTLTNDVIKNLKSDEVSESQIFQEDIATNDTVDIDKINDKNGQLLTTVSSDYSTTQHNLNPLETIPLTNSHQKDVDKYGNMYLENFGNNETKNGKTDNSINSSLYVTKQEDVTQEMLPIDDENVRLTDKKSENSNYTNDFMVTTAEGTGIQKLEINKITEKDSKSSNLSPEKDRSFHLENEVLTSKLEDVFALKSSGIEFRSKEDFDENSESISVENYIRNMIKNEIIAKYKSNVEEHLKKHDKESTLSNSLTWSDTHSLSKTKNESITNLIPKHDMDSDLRNNGEKSLSKIDQDNDEFVKFQQNLQTLSSKLTLNVDTHTKKLSIDLSKPSEIKVINNRSSSFLSDVYQKIEKPGELSTTNSEISKTVTKSPLATDIKDDDQMKEIIAEKDADRISLERNKELNNSSKSLILDLAFQAYVNERNETILKTFDVTKEPQRLPKDKVSVIRSTLNLNDKKILLEINSNTKLFLEMNNDNHYTFKDKAKGTKHLNDLENQHNLSTTNLKLLQESLAAIYENDLLPVEKLIKGLIQDIDKISKHRNMIKTCITIKKTKALKPTYSNKCGCIKK